jgi:ParB-like chromosome segregation protein Spo0J
MQYEAHPIADIFPEMSPEDYTRLIFSVKRDGLLEPIWLYEGCILDGRHRYKACAESGVEPRFEIFEGTHDDAMTFSLALNLNRRHMTTEQKAALGVSIKCYEAERARERMNAGVGLSCNDTGKARDKAGAAVGVSGKSVDKAEKIAELAPDVFDRMKQGQYGSLETAFKVSQLFPSQRRAVHEKIDEGETGKRAYATCSFFFAGDDLAFSEPETQESRAAYELECWQHQKSMSQDNRVIYAIHAAHTEFVKFGVSSKHPLKRLEHLQTGCPHKLNLLGYFAHGAMGFSEERVHQFWAYRGRHVRCEWFRVAYNEAVSFIDEMSGHLWGHSK